MNELSKLGRHKVEQRFANNREAHILLDLISAEFQSDPMSTQCFDSRIVERVRMCVATNKDCSFFLDNEDPSLEGNR